MSDIFLDENRFVADEEACETNGFVDKTIPCIDCSEAFVWSAGEQAFFRDKELTNPPKRCKTCKKAKNRRLDAIEMAKTTGKRHMIEVRVDCAQCSQSTTIPFYPSQGRPVYCRQCYQAMKAERAVGNSGG